MADFTSWCDVLSQMNNLLASGDVLSVSEVGKGDKRIRYRDMAEFERMYAWVEFRCNNERGLYTRRTYAKNGGRGEL